MTPHEQLRHDLLAERYGIPTPQYRNSTTVPVAALLDLLGEGCPYHDCAGPAGSAEPPVDNASPGYPQAVRLTSGRPDLPATTSLREVS